MILQRDRLTLPVVEIAKHSHDSGPSQQPGSFTLGARHVRQGRAVSRICRKLAQPGLGHHPQEGFRTLAVHTVSVLQLSTRRTGAPVSAWVSRKAGSGGTTPHGGWLTGGPQARPCVAVHPRRVAQVRRPGETLVSV